MGVGTKRDEVVAAQRGFGYDEGWVATNASAVTDATGLVVKAAPGAGKRLCITDFVVTNAGSGAGIWTLSETSAAGATLWRGVLAAGNTNVQSATVNLRKPIIAGENKSLWLYGVSSSSLFITINGFTAKTVDLR